MVPSGDTETGNEVVDHTPECCLPVEVGCEHAVDSDSWGDGDGEEGDPLDVLKEVTPGNRW